ncbi:MAG: hypothetical protein HRT61_03330 [Ekhidna sp.]|nr:hypothetical protein [Ekhidna sp.]
MLYLLRQIRRKTLQNNKITTYLLYAIGEIILVVVGILIAVQIDDVYEEKELLKQELNNYELIIADLKKDSASFARYHQVHSKYLDLYFDVNRISNGLPPLQEEPYFDYLVMNLLFSPVTQENHQNTIEKLKDQEVRAELNTYFGGLKGLKITTEEFNQYLREVSRPFFLRKHQVFDNGVVFDEQDRTFPPFKGVSSFQADKIVSALNDKEALPIVSELRMSMGAYLSFLQLSMQQNHALIQTLEKKISAE